MTRMLCQPSSKLVGQVTLLLPQVLSTMRDEGKDISPYTGYWLEIGPANGRLDRGRTGDCDCHILQVIALQPARTICRAVSQHAHIQLGICIDLRLTNLLGRPFGTQAERKSHVGPFTMQGSATCCWPQRLRS